MSILNLNEFIKEKNLGERKFGSVFQIVEKSTKNKFIFSTNNQHNKINAKKYK